MYLKAIGTALLNKFGVLIICSLLFFVACQKEPPKEVELNPEFRKIPPVVKTASIKLIGESAEIAKTALIVEFQKQEGIGDALAISLDDTIVVLRDDGQEQDETAGDGRFTGVIQLNLANLRNMHDRADSISKRVQTIPVFEGRQKTAEAEIKLFDLEAFLAGRPIEFVNFGFPTEVDAEKSLVITDPTVVGDPNRTFDPCNTMGNPDGKWTFKHLVTEMANESETGISPSELVRRWLRNWEFPQTINFDVVPERGTQIRNRIIDPWQAESDNISGIPNSPLNLDIAPFRLLAIVNRVDLRENLLYGGGSAGEARFVFGALDFNTPCGAMLFTVIFEYGIKKKSCSEVRAWARQWYDLKDLVLGSTAYNTALEAITQQFVAAGADPEKLPNKSALNQLRTNEIALGSPWELREFRLFSEDSDAGFLRMVTVKQTPDFSLNNTPVITKYINENEADILNNKHVVPLEFDFPPITPFLGGAAPVPTPFFFWDGPPTISDNDARHKFSLSTCNACHGGETGTVFTHVSPRSPGVEAALSGFMTGITVFDPVDSTPRHFNDLKLRALDLDGLVHSLCFFDLFFRPLLMVH